MKSIWKFPFPQSSTRRAISMPKGANIIKVGVQGGTVVLWAEVDTQAIKEARFFEVYRTGWEVDDDPRQHLDTVLDGPYVWHIYEYLGEVLGVRAALVGGHKQLGRREQG